MDVDLGNTHPEGFDGFRWLGLRSSHVQLLAAQRQLSLLAAAGREPVVAQALESGRQDVL